MLTLRVAASYSTDNCILRWDVPENVFVVSQHALSCGGPGVVRVCRCQGGFNRWCRRFESSCIHINDRRNLIYVIHFNRHWS